MSKNEELTPKQYTFISFLLAPMTMTEAAEKTGIALATATRWMNDSRVKQVLRETQADLFDQGMNALKSKFVKAVNTLDRNMNADQAADQIRSARVVIEQTIATQKLTERIAELEAMLAEQEQNLMYKVTFDLRHLTRVERDQLEAIEHARAARESTTA